jgi:hypothetical protein
MTTEDKYKGISVEAKPPEIDAVQCIICGCHAPLGVPIRHTEECENVRRK